MLLFVWIFGIDNPEDLILDHFEIAAILCSWKHLIAVLIVGLLDQPFIVVRMRKVRPWTRADVAFVWDGQITASKNGTVRTIAAD